jgi:hypothetical protein
MTNRNGVLAGESITLRVVVTDGSGELRNTDSLPAVYIYDQSVDDSELIQEEVDAATFASAFAGPLTPTLVAPGFYELTYTVPEGSTGGDWHDVWVGALNGVATTSIQRFAVTEGGLITTQSITYNQMIVIELDSSITNQLRTSSLREDIILTFSTVYKPYYASIELVRQEAGPWIEYVPDDTLALMIHWSSLEVDFIAPPCKCTADFKRARTRFVVYDTALKALTLPGGAYASALGSSAGDSKSLGELAIKKGNPVGSVLSGGVDLDTIKYFRGKREEWWRVVNAGGCIVPGEGLGPSFAVKGKYDPDKRLTGRLWEDPEEYFYRLPAANTRAIRGNRRRARHGFQDFRSRAGAVQIGGIVERDLVADD